MLRTQRRRDRDNRRLAGWLAFVAGAVNAGGFLVIGRYTSHVTGTVSSFADDLALGRLSGAVLPLTILTCFFSGALLSTVFIHFAGRRGLRSRYAIALLIEAALLLVFGRWGATRGAAGALAMAALLSLIMGLQNAIVTQISGAVVRTTHMTGIVTDLGIESGRLLYVNVHDRGARVLANRDKLKLHALILAGFFCGGVLGAIGFLRLGYVSVVPLAAVLALLAYYPVYRELRARWRAGAKGELNSSRPRPEQR